MLKNLSTLFWNISPNKLDFNKHSEFVIARTLEHGCFDQIKQLLNQISC